MVIVSPRPRQIDPAVAALSGHMNPSQRAAFSDKLHRYASKPDRSLFLACNTQTVLGFSLVITQLQPPADLTPARTAELDNLACGTGLMVLPAWRGRGVGRSLAGQWELWARKEGRAGVWCVTHRMAEWYRDCLGYCKLGRTRTRGVVKSVMVKRFSSAAADG